METGREFVLSLPRYISTLHRCYFLLKFPVFLRSENIAHAVIDWHSIYIGFNFIGFCPQSSKTL